MKKILLIDGIHCNSCAEKITSALYGLPQIGDLTLNVENKTAEVYLIAEVEDDLLKNIISSAGNFSVTNIETI